MSLASTVALQLDAVPGGLLGRLLVALVVVGLVVLVGRFALSIAWKLVTIAAIVVGALLLITMVL
jgi:hypothetical protein